MTFSGGYLQRSYFTSNNNFAIEFWARSNQVNEREAPVANGWVGTDNCWHGVWAGAQSTSLWAVDANTCSAAQGTPASTVFGNQTSWHYVVVQRVSGTTTVWIDGVQTPGADSGAITLNGGEFSVGSLYRGDPAGSYGPFKGAIADVAYYTHTLTSTQIANHYNAAVGSPTNTAAPAINPNSGIGPGIALSASTGTWTGAGLSYTYAWEDCDTAGNNCQGIAGATSSTYTLQSSDIGKTIRVAVTATDSQGAATATSGQSAVVAAQTPSGQALYGNKVLGDSPTGFWPLGDSTPNTAQDVSGNGNSLSWTGSGVTAGTTGPMPGGSGMTFSGGYLQRSYFANNNNFAMEFWARSNQVNEREAPVANGWVGTDNCWHGIWAAAQSTSIWAVDANTCYASPTTGGYSVFNDQTTWHYFVVQRVSGTTSVWIDGVQKSGSDSGAITLNGGEFSVGSLYRGDPTNSYGPFKGAISDVAYYTHTLTPAQIANHYNAALGPYNSALPTVSGTLTDGQTLTASNGTWGGSLGSYTYQWQDCDSAGNNCQNITGATASTYTLGHVDVGQTIRVVVTDTNAAGSAQATSARTQAVGAAPPANSSPPTISGTTTDGQTLSASNGSWSGTPGSYSYQWQSCDSASNNCQSISGATASTYTLGHSDVGATVRVVVTDTNSAGSAQATAAQTAVIAAAPPVNTAAPTISGTATAGYTLTASPGTWSGTPGSYSYQWQSCDSGGSNCTNLAGATAQTYPLGAGDVGTTVRVVVSDSNSAGTAQANSQQTAVIQPGAPSNTALPTIGGNTTDGQTLTASPGAWAGAPGSYAYQWQSCDSGGNNCTNLQGATGQTYVLGSGDVGKTLRVAVTDTNAVGSANASSAQTAVVSAAPPANRSAPTISGAPIPGQTLTAGPGDWAGTSPSYSYQWQRCDSSGNNCASIANGQTYQLHDADLGSTVRVAVTATNSAGSAGATSAQSAVVANACTDTWTGNAGDNHWQTAGNWSTGNVPTGGDQACVPAGAAPAVTAGSNQVWTLQDQGGLTISGGALTLNDQSGTSSVQSLWISGGYLQGNGEVDVTGSFSWTAGGMTGPGQLVIAAGVSGVIDPGANQTLQLQSGRTLVNHGTLTQNSGQVYVYDSDTATIVNAADGTLDLNGENGRQTPSGGLVGPGKILNSGTLQKTAGTAATTIAWQLDNEGTIDSQTGTLDVSGGSPAAGGIFGAGSGQWSTTASGVILFSRGYTAASMQVTAGKVTVTSNGTLNLTSTSTTSVMTGLALAGGVTGAGTVEITQSLTWTGGAMAGPGQTIVDAGASGVIDPGPNQTLQLQSGRTVVNHGTLTQNTGQIYVYDSDTATIVNSAGATLNLNGENGWQTPSGGLVGPGKILNSGTLQKTAGTATSTIAWQLDNEGTVDAQTGTFDVSGGSPAAGGIFGAGSGQWWTSGSSAIQFSRGYTAGSMQVTAGKVTVTSNGTLNLTSASTPSVMTGLALAGGVTGAGTVEITQSFRWTGGGMAGPGQTIVDAGASGVIDPGTNQTIYLQSGRTVVNHGTLTQNSGQVYVSDGDTATVVNAAGATLNLNGENGSLTPSGGLVGPGQILNSGTLQKTAGTGTSTTAWQINNQGSVEAQTGTLDFTGGSPTGTSSSGSWYAAPGAFVTFSRGAYTWGSGILLAGSIVDTGTGASITAADVQGSSATLTLRAGSFNVNGPAPSAIQTLAIAGGSLGGIGEFDVTRSLSWTAGGMAGTGQLVVDAGASGVIDPGANQTVDLQSGRTVVNHGTLTQNTGQVYVYDSDTATIINSPDGTLNLNGENGAQTPSGGLVGPGKILNSGTLQKTAGTGTSTIAWQLDNEAAIDSQTGTLEVSGGSPAAGGIFGAGSGQWWTSGSAAIVFSRGYTAASMHVTAGKVTVSSNGTLNLTSTSTPSVMTGLALAGGLTGAGTVEITQSFTWTSGGMVGPGETVIDSGASGSIDPGEGHSVYQQSGRWLVNHGALTEKSGQVYVSDGDTAVLINSADGTLDLNGETGGQSPMGGLAGPGQLINTGILRKSAGTGTTTVAWQLDNEHTIDTQTGRLTVSGGSPTGRGPFGVDANPSLNAVTESGSWSASSGASIRFVTTGFTLGANASLSGTVYLDSAVQVGALQANDATVIVDGELYLANGYASSAIGNLTLAGQIQGSGWLNVTKGFSWTKGGMTGSPNSNQSTGITVLGANVTGTIDPGAGAAVGLDGWILRNQGTLTESTGTVQGFDAALLDNRGALNLNADGGGLINSGGDPPVLYNASGATTQKIAGTQHTFVSYNRDNEGTINTDGGLLVLTGQPVKINPSTYEQLGPANDSEPEVPRCSSGGPVDCATGNKYEVQTDLAVGGRGVGLDLTRTYN